MQLLTVDDPVFTETRHPREFFPQVHDFALTVLRAEIGIDYLYDPLQMPSILNYAGFNVSKEQPFVTEDIEIPEINYEPVFPIFYELDYAGFDVKPNELFALRITGLRGILPSTPEEIISNITKVRVLTPMPVPEMDEGDNIIPIGSTDPECLGRLRDAVSASDWREYIERRDAQAEEIRHRRGH